MDSVDQLIEDTLLLLKKEPPRAPPPQPLPEKKAPPPQPEEKAPPPAPVKAPPKVEEKRVQLETVSLEMSETSAMKTLLKRVAPDLKIHDEIPSDSQAKRIKATYKTRENVPAVPLLYSDKEQLRFFNNICQAIEKTFFPSHPLFLSPLEEKKDWDLFLKTKELKLILITDTDLWSSLDLMRYYKERPQEGVRSLGSVPVILMADPKLYLSDPQLKRSLWQVISNTLKSS